MRYLIAGLLLVMACGDSTGPKPQPQGWPLTNLGAHEGVIRYTLATNCPAMTVLFGLDIFLYGPEPLTPGAFKDYPVDEGPHTTAGRSFPTASTTFPTEQLTVVAKQRVVRTLSCK